MISVEQVTKAKSLSQIIDLSWFPRFQGTGLFKGNVTVKMCFVIEYPGFRGLIEAVNA